MDLRRWIFVKDGHQSPLGTRQLQRLGKPHLTVLVNNRFNCSNHTKKCT